jgi:ATP-binding cassette subfamily B multidrug efflux pump
VTQHDLRERIGYVPQKSSLFSGTIESNLRYADEDATPAMLQSAIEIAQAKEFVDSKPEGMAAEIPRAAPTSRAGRSSVSPSRDAIVKKPPIYILDDSFSALDFKTDAALRRAFKEKPPTAPCWSSPSASPPSRTPNRSSCSTKADRRRGHSQGTYGKLRNL